MIRPAISPAPGAIRQQPGTPDSTGQPKPWKTHGLKNTVKITVNLDFAIDIYGKSCYSITVIKQSPAAPAMPGERKEKNHEKNNADSQNPEPL